MIFYDYLGLINYTPCSMKKAADNYAQLKDRKQMARETNNELLLLPGFFFYPKCSDGLEELTRAQRILFLTNQGVHSIELIQDCPDVSTDIDNLLDNSRIPTHRRPGTLTPGYGSVPMDLREVIELKS